MICHKLIFDVTLFHFSNLDELLCDFNTQHILSQCVVEFWLSFRRLSVLEAAEQSGSLCFPAELYQVLTALAGHRVPIRKVSPILWLCILGP